jgi:predicted dehydrogenase
MPMHESRHTNHQSDQPDASRRNFLATTAMLGAATWLGTSALADPRKTGPMPKAMPRVPLANDEPIRMGVIGTGGMGTAHCHSIISLAEQGRENVRIVAVSDVCDSHLERARNVCATRQGVYEKRAKTPQPAASDAGSTDAAEPVDVEYEHVLIREATVDTYRDYRDLLKRDDIHGVLIASPEHWHGQMARDAIIAGKDVYVEKPVTLRLDDALKLRAVALHNPEVILQIGTQMIMLPKYVEARRLIREGAIGKPTSSQTSYCRNSMDGEWLYYGIDPNWEPGVNLDWEAWCGHLGPQPWDPAVYARWRRYRRWSTGIIGDLLVHVMTPLVMALDAGWPTRVIASGGHYVDTAMENHDQVNLTIEFEDGHTMIVAGSTCNEVGLETMIRGHEANLYLGGRHVELRPERIFSEDIEPRRIECEDIGNDQDQLRLNWLRSIRTREPAISNIDLATKVMVIVDLATRSMWDGGAFAFDPKNMKATRI